MADINNSLSQAIGGTFNQDNIFRIKRFNYSGTPTKALFASKINALSSFTIGERDVYIFSATDPSLASSVPMNYKIVLRNIGKGTYGLLGTQITAANIEILSVLPIDLSSLIDSDTTQIINFGEIGATNISNYLNALSPSISIQDQEDGYVIVKTLVSSVETNYLFLGVGGVYGLTGLQTTDLDFELFSEAIGAGILSVTGTLVTGTLSNPIINIPTLQQVVDQDNTIIDSAIILNNSDLQISLSNGEIGIQDYASGIGNVIDASNIYHFENTGATVIGFNSPTGYGTINFPDVVDSTETVALLSDLNFSHNLLQVLEDGNEAITNLNIILKNPTFERQTAMTNIAFEAMDLTTISFATLNPSGLGITDSVLNKTMSITAEGITTADPNLPTASTSLFFQPATIGQGLVTLKDTAGTFQTIAYMSDLAGVSSSTNLTYTASPTNGIVNSDTGTDATLLLADNTNAGLFSSTEKIKLSGIATGANVGVVPNSAITGATRTKITYDSKGLVTGGVDATTADIADSTGKRYQTENQKLYNDATSSIQGQLDSKQDILSSGVSIKSLNGSSLLGSGNIDLTGNALIENTAKILQRCPDNDFRDAHASIVINNKMYLGTRAYANEHALLKCYPDPDDLTTSETLTLPIGSTTLNGINGIETICYNEVANKLYMTLSSTGNILTVNPDDLTDYTITAIPGAFFFGAGSITTDGTHIYIATEEAPNSHLWKLLASDLSIVATNTWTGRSCHGGAIDTANGFAYYTMAGAPSYLAKVSLSDLSYTELLLRLRSGITDDIAFAPAFPASNNYIIVGGESRNEGETSGAIIDVDNMIEYDIDIMPSTGMFYDPILAKLYNAAKEGYIEVWDWETLVNIATGNGIEGQDIRTCMDTYSLRGYWPNEILLYWDGTVTRVFNTVWQNTISAGGDGLGALMEVELVKFKVSAMSKLEAMYRLAPRVIQDNTTTTYTSAQLTTKYPSLKATAKVYCPNIIIGGAAIYEKTLSGWFKHSVTIP